LEYAYWNRKSFSERGVMTQVWLRTADCRGTPKSKLALGVVRPPVVMIGRYSSSAPHRKNTL